MFYCTASKCASESDGDGGAAAGVDNVRGGDAGGVARRLMRAHHILRLLACSVLKIIQKIAHKK